MCSKTNQPILFNLLLLKLNPSNYFTLIMKTELDTTTITKSVWVHDDQECFVTKFVVSETGEEIVCTDGSKYKKENVYRTNPEKFAALNDLTHLSYINEPSVLECLKNRLEKAEIYTNSGMFLISVNPYKKIQSMYSDATKREIEVKRYEKPHIFKTVDTAYEAMLETGVNQSILVTGESGAGKTENTKKVIEYLSFISCNTDTSLSSLLLSCNPLLEAFGNAKTIKNENSSRFGKFIQVFFSNKMICGSKIDTYLLEVSRVTKQERGERNYHIFYFLLNSGDTELLKELNLQDKNYTDFNLLKGGSDVAYGMDDAQEYKEMLRCFNVFKINYKMYLKGIAAVMHLSNIEFKEVSGGKVEVIDMEMLKNVANLLGKDMKDLHDALVNPSLNVGRETVKKSTTIDTCKMLVEAIIKNLYSALFQNLIAEINNKFACTNSESSIGVLDIAGFEIFQKNSFEQLLINYTNEKLQQFFNTKVFEEEQKTYKSECISWDYIDFGLSLDPCIKAIDGNNPIGILSYLDEECVMPGATDDSVLRKITSINITASDNKKVITCISRKKECFGLNHYAGLVEYTIEDWILKNKQISSDKIDELIGNVTMSKKKGIFRTLAQGHREQLKQLMTMLSTTRPHFVRCILPNLKKRFDVYDKQLVLDQLRCNGILEGLRIARLGFPTRVSFAEFCSRYSFYINESSQSYIKSEFAMKILKELEKINLLTPETYQVGKTLIFFRHGILAEIENHRIEFLVKMASAAQGALRHLIKSRKENFAKIRDESVEKLKKDIAVYREYTKLKWFRLYKRVKPLLAVRSKDMEQAEINRKLNDMQEKVNKAEEENKYLKENMELLKNKIVNLGEEHKQEKEYYEYNLTQVEELNQGLRTAKQEKEEKICILEKNIGEMQKEFETKAGMLKEKESDIQKVQEELERLNAQLKSKNAEMDSMTEKNSEVVNRFNMDLEDKEGQLKSKIAEMLKMTNKLKEMEEDNEELIKKMDEIKSSGKKQIDALNQSINELKTHSTTHSSRATQLEEELAEKEDKLSKLSKKIERMSKDIEELTESNNKITEEKMEAMLKAETELQNLKNQHVREIGKLKNQLSEMEEENERNNTQKQNEEQKKEIKMLKEEHLRKINELEMEKYQIQQRLESIDLDVLKREVKAAKDAVKETYYALSNRMLATMKEYNEFYLEPYRQMEKMKEEHSHQIEKLQECYDKLFKQMSNEESYEKVKIRQLERINKCQEEAMEEMIKNEYHLSTKSSDNKKSKVSDINKDE